MTSMRKRVLSGMRPTGPLHLGHLLGAIKNWVKLQEKYECMFMVADWHALMSEYADPAVIKKSTVDMAIDWIGCGIDPKKSTIFIQSHVPEHLELAQVFSDIAPLSWLERCPTYKEQLREQKNRDLTTYGFLGYPILQAADILLYQAHAVPVGEDQLPHLELTRELVRRFHHFYKKKLFPEPKPILTETPRLLGTDNRKMSKTYNNYIALSDPPDVIRKKVMSMITDPARQRKTDPGHPDVCNVYSYYKTFKPGLTGEINKDCTSAKIGCMEDKERLAEILIEELREIRKNRKKLEKDRGAVERILKKGAHSAGKIASSTMAEVKDLLGLIRL